MNTSRLPDDVELRRLYLEEHHTMQTIAGMFGVSRQRVHQRLQKACVKRPKLNIDQAILEDLYLHQKLRMQQIAERLGVSDTYISKELRRHGVPVRPLWRFRMERELLYKLYVTDGMLIREIAEMVGWSRSTIALELKRHKITVRHNPAARRKQRFSRDQLHSLYIDQKLSTPEIGELVGCNESTVTYWLEKFGIARRVGGTLRKPVDGQQLRKLYLKEGLTLQLIAERLGISVSTVYENLKRIGIPPNRKRKHRKRA